MWTHIDSILHIESYYLRSQTTREYIQGGKTIAAIYHDYVKQCDQTGKAYGTLSLFPKIFNTEYNISSNQRKISATCIFFTNLDDVGKLEKRGEFVSHQSEKKNYSMKERSVTSQI